MEYLSNLVAYRKYQRIMNSKVVFSQEEWDEIILGVDEKIREKAMLGETEVTIWGDLSFCGKKRKYYNLKEIHEIFEFLDYYYYSEQGFKVKVRTGNKLSKCTLRIKLRKVK